jgi:hypothetical protein
MAKTAGSGDKIHYIGFTEDGKRGPKKTPHLPLRQRLKRGMGRLNFLNFYGEAIPFAALFF